jgi:hypothetical protein
MRESAQAIRAFSDYLAQPAPRSLERLAQTYQTCTEPAPPTRHLTTLKQWSREHGWQERILAHERMLAEEAAREDAQKRQQAGEARLGIATQVIAESYRQFLEMAREGPLAPYAALQALQLAFETQRKDLGEPDQRVKVGGADGDAMTVRVIYDNAAGGDEWPA